MKLIYLIAVLALAGCAPDRDDQMFQAHTKWLEAHDKHLAALEKEIASQQKLLESQQEVIAQNARATALAMEYLHMRQKP